MDSIPPSPTKIAAREELMNKIKAQGDVVRKLKEQKALKAEVNDIF